MTINLDRAALREKARAYWCGRCITGPGTMESPCEMCGSISGTVLALLDALDAAERKLDQARATLRAAANRARGIAQSAADDEAALAVLGPLVAERDEARSACAAMREAARSLVLSVRATAEQRDGAIARAEVAERERDAFRAQAEASLVVPCACGRPMPSVSSRLRCDACRAEGERDEARAQTAAFRAVLSDIAEDYGVPYDDQQCGAPKRATEALEASDAGASLLAELRALRKVLDERGHDADCQTMLPDLFPGPAACGCRLRAALDAAKVGG